MLKKTLLFTSPAYLSVQYKQLVIQRTGKEEVTIPVEDIGFIVLDHRQITVSSSLINDLLANNVALITCDDRHHPNGMHLALDSHSVQQEIFRHQLDSSKPLMKHLWQQTVSAKIRNQALLLKELELPYKDLLEMARTVKSGDSDQREGSAARLYWRRLMGGAFRRDRDGPAPNHFLNYGYTLLRAAVARALVGSGLLPTLGIHHKNRYNAFCLADDIMEPYRPFVDRVVVELHANFPDEELTPEIKQNLLELLRMDVHFKKVTRPLMVGLSQTSASLARCFSGDVKTIEYPVLNGPKPL